MQYFQYNLFNSDFFVLFKNKFHNNETVVISTINPHSFVVAENDSEFKKALINSDYLLVDGIGLKIVLLFKFKIVKLLNGPELHNLIIKNFRNTKLRVFYMGSTNVVLSKIKEKINKDLPLWEVDTFSPPFSKTFSDEQNKEIIKNINKFQPDILFIGMTAPKQEKWVNYNKEQLNAKYIISIGAVFDFYSEEKKSAPNLFVFFNLIWLYRLITDFKHVWKRTFVSIPLFIYYNIINSINRKA